MRIGAHATFRGITAVISEGILSGPGWALWMGGGVNAEHWLAVGGVWGGGCSHASLPHEDAGRKGTSL